MIIQAMQKEKKNHQDQKTSKLIDLYIRNNKKQALLIHTPPNANLSQVRDLIRTRFRVPQDQQVLYYNGQQLPASEQGVVEVQDKAILHLVDKRNVTEELVINVRRLNVPRSRQFRVPATQIIEDFIVREIQQEENNRYFFVYTGRELNARSTFGQEFVENESELFCLDEVNDQVIGERRSMYEKRSKASKQAHFKQGKETKESKSTAAAISQSKVVTIRPIQEIQLNRPNNNMYNTAPVPQQKRQEEVITPNFKKKTISQQVNIVGQAQLTTQANEISTSLVAQPPLQQTKSNIVPNTLFNQSISSIFLQQNHNPQSKRIDEGSMFQSAIIGLNNQSVINAPALASRANSIINQSDSHEDQPREEPALKSSFSFDNRAPEMIPHQRQLAALDQQEIIEQSKEDYTESKQISAEFDQDSPSKILPVEIQKKGRERQNSKDLSGYQLQSVENHQLSASAQLEMQMFQTKNSPSRNSNSNQILIQDFDRQESKTLEYLGVEIQPIQHNHHQSQTQQSQQHQHQQKQEEHYHKDNQRMKSSDQIRTHLQSSDRMKCSDEIETPHFRPTPQHVDVYLIEEEDLAQQTQSEMVEEKEERETNRYSNSNFYSSNSSRAKHYDVNNQYNFGQFQKVNKNRFSGCREGTPKYEQQLQSSLSQHHQPIEASPPFLRLTPTTQPTKKEEQQQKSLNIVELPVQAHVKDSSLLIDQDINKSDFIYNQNNFRSKGGIDLARQSSGIEQLNKLFSQIDKPPLQKQNSVVRVEESPVNDSQGKVSEPSLVNNQHPQDAVETSLNLRMSDRGNRQPIESSSPIIKESKCIMQSSQSLQKIQVKNSLPYFNSYSRSISSQMRFTSRKEIYNIGDFVLTADINTFNPFAFFVQSLARQDAMDIYKSYP